jgi:cytochrome o ubiquinol oxidase subunit 2
LTSSSVKNAFFIPQLGSMIYTMNGMVTRLQLRADTEGTYQGLSAHFSGDGFPDMMFDVHVVSQMSFADWASQAAGSGQTLNADSYSKLARQSVPGTRTTYRLDDPLLFQAVATQQIPAAPGPSLSEEATVSPRSR